MATPPSIEAQRLARVDRAKQENEDRRTFIQMAGGFVVIVGVFHAWRTLQATREKNADGRKQFTFEQLQQLMEWLSSDDEPVRVGAVQALRVLAEQERALQPQVTAVLLAHVRYKARWDRDKHPTPPPSDVLLAVQLLLSPSIRPAPSSGEILDLRNLNLGGLELPKGASYSNIDFSDSYLAGAAFSSITLENCLFRRSRLENADFDGHHLVKCDYSDARATATRFGSGQKVGCVWDRMVVDESTAFVKDGEPAPAPDGWRRVVAGGTSVLERQ